MEYIVVFPDVRGNRYYLKKNIISHGENSEYTRVEYQLACERDEATKFNADEAGALAKALHGSVRESTWQEDEKKICLECRKAKSLDDFYSAANARYPKTRRSYCKKCDNQRRFRSRLP